MMNYPRIINGMPGRSRSGERDRLFGHIWKTYRKRLYYYITSVMNCSREDGEDLLQEIMMKAYGTMEGFGRGRSFDAWIYAIARNHCIDFHRKMKKRREEDEYREGDGASPDLLDDLCNSELNRVIHACLGKLAEGDREMVYLRHFEGLTHRSIGTIIGMNVNSVKTRLRAIEARLRHELRGWL